MQPFLKWPGGKRWFMKKYSNIFPLNYEKYIEPFLGSGSTFFHLLPPQSILSDSNSELITLYEVMRDAPLALGEFMLEHERKHCKDYYYLIRSKRYENKMQHAARFLYLNRTCYNGMYRVNKKGEFNVPIGTKANCARDVDVFEQYSEALKNSSILSCDFEDSIAKARRGDLLFVDPPYAVSQSQNAFVKYNNQVYAWNDQIRLLTALCAAKARDCKIVATNANNEQLKALYLDNGFYVQTLTRSCVMAANPEKRSTVGELLITSYPIN